jgi:RNA recognition motif-containing protein
VASINVVRDRATGQARGFAFVEMADAESAQRAIKELDRHQYGGRNLTVNEAKPMEPRGNNGGGGGFRPSAPRIALVRRFPPPDLPRVRGDFDWGVPQTC